jgi:hypothetical protein
MKTSFIPLDPSATYSVYSVMWVFVYSHPRAGCKGPWKPGKREVELWTDTKDTWVRGPEANLPMPVAFRHQIALQCLVPRTQTRLHQPVKARAPQRGVAGTTRPGGILLRGYRFWSLAEARQLQDFPGKLIPGAGTGVGEMDKARGPLA